MDATFVALIIIVLVALAFDYTNGFHDAANAIAVAVSTKALTPRVALALAAVMNLVGALLSTEVAKTVGAGIIDPPEGSDGLQIVFAALIGAIVWNLITWWFGLPSSSSHALIGGLVGAAVAAAHTVQWMGVLDKVIIPMVVSPLVGFGLGYLFMLAILWTFHSANVTRANRGFRYAQIVSSATMALGHGLQDAQKTMGIITLALVTAGEIDSFDVPLWVVLSAALALSAGTYAGGFRIMRTLGRRIIQLTPAGGFSAQTVASGVMVTTATVFAVPVSTTHITTTSIMGVGATRRLSAVRWGVAGSIVIAWVVTLPAAGLVAALAYVLTHSIIG
ncbi:inorganic phosphate transporter [Geodermatophilus sabuli]|uniref:Inorganic phosphate transporter, PiT family n=1 Tax=Geodermatophilus sabuli TaxID=1564158 RepID=A0A285E5J1_9ACTN|nr:inorganic phosphate transporter [Geodermatophilus sabuli]MBB3082858.1 PiT family inorganic phosphate transporter [Geodermatophilus sabuli]SNX94277.1 inorganic phosphate transporter, PiT family [Geodermatophilus sabuli]